MKARVYRSLNLRPLIFGLPSSVLLVVWGFVIYLCFAGQSLWFLLLGGFLHPILFFLYTRDKFILEILRNFMSRKGKYAGTVESQNMKEYANANRISEEITFLGFVDQEKYPGVVEHTHQRVSRTYKIVPEDCITKTDYEIDRVSENITKAINSLDELWTVHVTILRLKDRGTPSVDVPESISDLYNQQEHISLSSRYSNEYYITLLYKLTDKKESWWQKMFGMNEKEEDIEFELEDVLNRFIGVSDEFTDILSESTQSLELMDGPEILSYIHKELYLEDKSYHVGSSNTMTIPDYFDAGVIETGNTILTENDCFGVLGINAFPDITSVDMFEDFGFDFNVKLSFVYTPWSHETTKKKLESNRKTWTLRRVSSKKAMRDAVSKDASGESPEDINIEAALMLDDAEEAIAAISMDHILFGEMQTVMVFSGTNDSIVHKKREDELFSYLQRQGFSPIKESRSLNADLAYWSCLPGKGELNVRRHKVSSANFATMFPSSAPYAGLAVNKHLQKISGVGLPHIRCLTHNKQIYHLNLNSDGKDVGHTFIAGATGAGKSVLLSTITMSWLKYPQGRVIVFDKDYSSLPVTALAGGRFIEPMNADNATNFNLFSRFVRLSEQYHITQLPEAKVELGEEVVFLAEFLAMLGELNGVSLRAEEKTQLKEIISMSYQGRDCHHLQTLNEMIKSHSELKELYSVLLQYEYGGIYGNLFDSKTDFSFGESVTTIEMGTLMEKGAEVLIPTLLYIFHQINQTIHDLRPTLIVLDEAWVFLKNRFFMEKIEEWLRTFRKKNVFLVLASQDTVDLDRSDISSLLRNNCPTKIFLPNPNAKNPEIAQSYKNFGLTDIDIEILSEAKQKRDYYIATTDHSRLINLHLTKDMVKFISSHQQKSFYLDLIRENVGFQEAYESIKNRFIS